jgi:hypothetical protein
MNWKINPQISFAALAAVALGWGGACAFVGAPYALGALGALGAAALSLWLARGVIEPPAGGGGNMSWLVVPAYGFLAMMALGLATVAYFFVRLKLHR